MKRIVGISLLLLAFVPAALADLAAIGDPYESGSWSQQFYENGIWGANPNPQSYDLIALRIVSGPDTFESQAITGFSTGYGWHLMVDTPNLAVAGGNALAGNMYNTLHFTAPNYASVVLDYACFSGDTLLGTQRLYYAPASTGGLSSIGNGWYAGVSNWAPDRTELMAAVVPAPGAALLIGLGLSLVGWLKRRIA